MLTRTTEETEEKKDKRRKSSQSLIRAYFNRLMEPAVIRNITPCSADQCSLPGPGLNYSEEIYSQPICGLSLPPELYKAMQISAAKGFLYNFLCSLDEEFLRAYLREHHYSDTQIYWVNKTVRALTLIAFGAAYGKTLALPLLTCLIASYCGINEQYASLMTSALFLSIDLCTSEHSNRLISMASFIASIGAGAIGYTAGKILYHYRSTLTNGFFSDSEETVLQMEELEDVTDEATAVRPPQGGRRTAPDIIADPSAHSP